MSATLRRAFTRGAATLALLSTACLDDRPVGPNDDARGPAVRLGFQATILGAAAGQTVHIRAFYLRLDGTDVTLENAPTEVSVTPGVPQQVAVVVRIAQCLADPQHTGGSPKACEVGIDLTLEDEDGTVIDEQTSAPTQALPPGSRTAPPGRPRQWCRRWSREQSEAHRPVRQPGVREVPQPGCRLRSRAGRAFCVGTS